MKPDINETKVPAVRIDPALDKYDHVVLFPDKLAQANEQIGQSGFPAQPEKKHSAQQDIAKSNI